MLIIGFCCTNTLINTGPREDLVCVQANVESWATVTKLERMRLTQDGDSVVIWRSDL